MKNKRLLALTITIITASTLVINGCSNKKDDAEPVTAEATEEPEITEEPEPEAEPEENAVNAIDGLNEGTTISRDTGSSEETPDTTGDSATFIESGADGVDTATDEEVEADNEALEAAYANPEGMDENHDGTGVNKTTGEYEADFDTNNGQGWDINGVHYKTRGEYNKSPEMTQDMMTPEELAIEEKAAEIMKTNRNGVKYIYDESGKLIDAVPNNPNNE